jgi:phosphoglycerol transferase MdoB-like AlkP superfamily enzyme
VMDHSKKLVKYFPIYVFSLVLCIGFRILETSLIFYHYGHKPGLFKSELIGTLNDLLVIILVMFFCYLIYNLISKKSTTAANLSTFIVLSLFSIIHLLIIKYFFYQLSPLDASLFKYSPDEVFFTINTSNVSYPKILISEVLLILLIVSAWRYLHNYRFSERFIYKTYFATLVSIPLLVGSFYTSYNGKNNFSRNKSLFFYSRTAMYLFEAKTNSSDYSSADLEQFRKLYPDTKFISKTYPLLHRADTMNQLGIFFNRFDSAPNIVVLIVEGLNDDFIHTYKEIKLMPFLDSLKDNSLYWNHCFTLGERSFAVVPSLLGSLPYGQKGFTLIDQVPRHITLVSLLHSNGYNTSFFYGQGSWFHQKDRFFDFNNIDQVVDNRKFAAKYKKIIVGDDHFFWGYNDKELFNQSLEVIDTIPAKRRLDIYFTGTSHSPFQISDESYYDMYIKSLLDKTSEKEFFTTYQKYIKTILFVDDALRSFFDAYKKRPDFANTLFVITGDHPMTEIPITNSLKRYHVPLILYSQRLKTPVLFNGITSHLDVYQSLLTFLKPYGIKVPANNSALGNTLNTTPGEMNKIILFMNDNRDVVDIYADGYFMSQEKLFQVDTNLQLTDVVENKIFNKLNKKREIFNKTNLYVCNNDMIIPDDLYCESLGYSDFFSSRNAGSISFEAEFMDITPSINIADAANLNYDINFNFNGEFKDIVLAYQLADQKDSVIYWNSAGIESKNGVFQTHIRLPERSLLQATHFKSYFWKKNKGVFSYSNTHILLSGNPKKQKVSNTVN